MLHKTILVLSSLLFCVSVYAEDGSEDFFVGREINYNNLSLAAKNTSGSIDKIVKKSNVIFLELKNKDYVPNFKLHLEQPEEVNPSDYDNKVNIYSRQIELTTYYNNSYEQLSMNYGLSFRNQEDTFQAIIDNKSSSYTYSQNFIPLMYFNLEYALSEDINIGSTLRNSYYVSDGYSEQAYYLEYYLYNTRRSKTSIEFGNITNTYSFSNSDIPALSTSGPYMQLKFNF